MILYIAVGNLQYVIQSNFMEFVALRYGTFRSKYLNIPSDTTIFIHKVPASFSHDWSSSGYIILLSRIFHVHSYYNDIIVKCLAYNQLKEVMVFLFRMLAGWKCLRYNTFSELNPAFLDAIQSNL